MTTIACGGGPTIEQRRSFAALKDGTQVPGYRGYIPQIKYRVGKTYGNDTHDLAQDFPQRRSLSMTVGSVVPDVLRNELPEPTGDNKYTKSMVPGYTGYIPRMPFKFGGTYKEDCDRCIDNFMTNRQIHDSKTEELRRHVQSYPKLTAISHDPEVRDKLNLYRDTHPVRTILLEDKRPLTEPPVPGYQGYIPRIGTTDVGLGCRYNQSSKNGLEMFVRETTRHARLNEGNEPITLNKRPISAQSAPASFSRRLYLPDGMIPKYTGYIPQRRYAFGNTYGDTTRMLDVCHHDRECYGKFARTRNPKVAFA